MLNDWTQRLATATAKAVREFAPTLAGEPVILLALDCHPWHGSIDLAVLTHREVEASPFLHNPTEMASWQHFYFSSSLESWKTVDELAAEMKAAYYSASDMEQVAEAFMIACAHVAFYPEVVESVELFVRHANFRISVTHPDNGHEFVTGSSR